MKLLFCPDCGDIVALLAEVRACRCGLSWGRYDGERLVVVGGPAVPLAIIASSLRGALAERASGEVAPVAACLLPDRHDSVRRVRESKL